jgi:polysaccharide export outer membrane protein
MWLMKLLPLVLEVVERAQASGKIYQVEEDGTVALPVIGHIAVTGLTRGQAAKLIEDLYRKNLLKDPIIEVKITNLKVTLLGEFKGQGNFPLVKDKTTLVEMIGEAGGLSDRANETNIKIIRGDQRNPQVTYINLRDIQSINDPRAILQNGDIIYASQNKRSIRNENLQNVSTLTQPILLLLNTALVILSFSHR